MSIMKNINKILRKLKIDKLLNNLKESSEYYKMGKTLTKIARQSIYLTGGAPITNEEPTSQKGDIYLILKSFIPEKYFDWAER